MLVPQEAPRHVMAGASMPRAALRAMLGGDVCSVHHTTGTRTGSPASTAWAAPSAAQFRWGSAQWGPLCTADVLSPSCTENGYTSTDEEVSEFSLASDGR